MTHVLYTCIDNNVTNMCDPSLCVCISVHVTNFYHLRHNRVAIAAVIHYMFNLSFACTCIVCYARVYHVCYLWCIVSYLLLLQVHVSLVCCCVSSDHLYNIYM